MKFKVGTRGSALALRQTELVIKALQQEFDKYTFEVVKIKTKGDKILDSPLSRIPGKGFFVKEIEDELIKGNIEFAVHSLKDLPTDIPDGLTISFLKRDPPFDVMLGLNPQEINEMIRDGKEVRIGTSSLRREIQLREMFGNIKIIPIRGNLDTRLRKMKDDGVCDALVVAYCGVLRLGFEQEVKHVFGEDFLYAPGQGIIVIETRYESFARELASSVEDQEARFIGILERKILKMLGGGCNTPFGIFTSLNDGVLKIKFRLFGRIEFQGEFDVKKMSDDVVNEIVQKISADIGLAK